MQLNLSHAVTLITCGHTFHMWPHFSHVATFFTCVQNFKQVSNWKWNNSLLHLRYITPAPNHTTDSAPPSNIHWSFTLPLPILSPIHYWATCSPCKCFNTAALIDLKAHAEGKKGVFLQIYRHTCICCASLPCACIDNCGAKLLTDCFFWIWDEDIWRTWQCCWPTGRAWNTRRCSKPW